MVSIAILLLAAGQSSRMGGRDKLLERINGETLLHRQARRALKLGVPVYVTLPPATENPERWTELTDMDLTSVQVANARDGMGTSIAAGVGALDPAVTGVAVLPADMPDITTFDLETVRIETAKNKNMVHRATTADGRPGHPVYFPKRLFPKLMSLSGDDGARRILKTEQVVGVPIQDDHALTDLDTPDAWAAWRAVNGCD